jgi:hypothetical protein
MMAFDERMQFLLLGMAIGFVLGYLVRLIKDIKDELDEVKEEIEEVLPKTHQPRDEKGFMRFPLVADIALLLVVGLAFFAAVASQKASNDLSHTVQCNQSYLRAQADFLSVILQDDPPATPRQQRVALQKYYTLLSQYAHSDNLPTDAASKYPLNPQFKNCTQ